VSIDTRKPVVARAAVAAGATLWNDVGAANGDAAADLGVAWAAMHAQGEPATMQRAPRYDDVVAEVRHELITRAEAALAAGVPAVWIDPGIGFGKTFEHNLALLAHLDELVATGHPVLVGTSRKGFLGALLGSSDGAPGPAPVEDRLEGSLTTAVWAMTTGAAMIRAHDVRATAHAALVIGGHITKDAAA
jgi:dihydropteroate synthase